MAWSVDDGSSDYGLDFTPDEEELINNLLTKAIAEHAIAVHSLPTAPPVRDIEDYGGPTRIQSPKVLGRVRLGSPPQGQSSRLDGRRPGQTPGYGGTAFCKTAPPGHYLLDRAEK